MRLTLPSASVLKRWYSLSCILETTSFRPQSFLCFWYCQMINKLPTGSDSNNPTIVQRTGTTPAGPRQDQIKCSTETKQQKVGLKLKKIPTTFARYKAGPDEEAPHSRTVNNTPSERVQVSWDACHEDRDAHTLLHIHHTILQSFWLVRRILWIWF